MKARYTGQENPPGSGSTIVFGNTRVKVGEVFDVPPQFENIVLKNRFFEQVGPVENAVEGTKDVLFGKDRDTSGHVSRTDRTDVQAEDEDNDARAYKADLIAHAETAGVTIDKRWSAAKIKTAIEAKAKEDGQVYDVSRRIGQEQI